MLTSLNQEILFEQHCNKSAGGLPNRCVFLLVQFGATYLDGRLEKKLSNVTNADQNSLVKAIIP